MDTEYLCAYLKRCALSEVSIPVNQDESCCLRYYMMCVASNINLRKLVSYKLLVYFIRLYCCTHAFVPMHLF